MKEEKEDKKTRRKESELVMYRSEAMRVSSEPTQQLSVSRGENNKNSRNELTVVMAMAMFMITRDHHSGCNGKGWVRIWCLTFVTTNAWYLDRKNRSERGEEEGIEAMEGQDAQHPTLL